MLMSAWLNAQLLPVCWHVVHTFVRTTVNRLSLYNARLWCTAGSSQGSKPQEAPCSYESPHYR